MGVIEIISRAWTVSDIHARRVVYHPVKGAVVIYRQEFDEDSNKHPDAFLLIHGYNFEPPIRTAAEMASYLNDENFSSDKAP